MFSLNDFQKIFRSIDNLFSLSLIYLILNIYST